MNSAQLKIHLLCRGIQLDSSVDLDADARPILRTRGGLASGIEGILPGGLSINIPVYESFAADSPFSLVKKEEKYYVFRDEEELSEIVLPPNPKFYSKKTSSGKLMSRIGVMQGTYLGIYPTDICEFWKTDPPSNCRFCSVGLNLGSTEDIDKTDADLLETTLAAMQEEKITFVHFNAGYLGGKELEILEHYIELIKKNTPLMVGLQAAPSADYSIYERLKKKGVDHLSFCIELFDEERLKEVCPGKSRTIGRKQYLDTIEACSKIFMRGRVSGEIIAGLEPAEKTIEAIDYFAKMGVVSTVCIFRPLIGTQYENLPSPKPEDMIPIFQHLYRTTLYNRIPLGMAPNIKVSIVMLAEEGRGLIEKKGFRLRLCEMRNSFIKFFISLYFKIRIRYGKIRLGL
ncbi:MAG: hypothetical protein GX817_03825 [Elusimicrobia bacterium]|nr:hypothetical protein [Elusimicrobiota bacterium]